MRICHVTDRLPGFHKATGGAEHAALRVIRLLDGAPGTRTHVLSIAPETEAPETDAREGFSVDTLKTSESYLWRGLRPAISGLKNRCVPFDPVSLATSYSFFRRLRPDVVHIHKAGIISLSVVLSARALGIPVAASVYDYLYFCPGGFLVDDDGGLCSAFNGPECARCNVFSGRGASARLMLRLRRRSLVDFFLERISAFIVLSGSSARILASYGIDRRRIHVIPQAMAADEMSADASGGGRPSVFFAGWMDRKKGLHILVRAMPEVVKANPEAVLDVFDMPADDGYASKIAGFIAENALENNVRFHGRAAREEFEKTLKEAACVAVPEQWENMSPVILAEAMMAAKPVIASSVGGIPEFITDGESGFLVDRDDPTEFARRIIWVLRNRERAEEMGRRARAKALDIFDAGKVCKKYMGLYAALTGTHGERVPEGFGIGAGERI